LQNAPRVLAHGESIVKLLARVSTSRLAIEFRPQSRNLSVQFTNREAESVKFDASTLTPILKSVF
jgi:hypothetical protein